MKKEKVVIGLPISFMKKGDFGYVSYNYIPLVYDENASTDVDSLKIYRLIAKNASLFKFPMDQYVRITKIGEGWSAEDFTLVFPISLAVTPVPITSLSLNDYFDGKIEVDWEILEEMTSICQNIDLSNYTYLELCNVIYSYADTTNFGKIKKSAEDVLEHIPAAMKVYLKNFDDQYLNIFYKQILDDKEEEVDCLPPSEIKTFLEDFYAIVVLTLKDYMSEKTKTPLKAKELDELDQKELKRLLDQAIEAEDFELAKRIKEYLN